MFVSALLALAVTALVACQATPAPQTPAPSTAASAAAPTASLTPFVRPTLPPTALECLDAAAHQLQDSLDPSAPPTMTQHDQDIMPFCEAQLSPSP